MVEREIPTLGGAVGCWIQSHCAIPDGEHQGAPFLLTAEQWDFLLRFYALDERGQFVYRRGAMLVRPAKHGKGPLSAAIIAAEAAGPTRFAGWEDGEPIGKPPATPWVQVAAVSEDQTANVWRALVPMLQLGDIAHEVDDVGLTRVNLPAGGRIEFVTAAHRSRVGQRTTFAVMDELGFWLPGNHGHELADAIARNLAGMGGRFLATTNAWAVDEESVAQRIAETGGDGVYVDDRDPTPYSINNKAERRKALRSVYGDSAAGCEAQGNAAGRIEPWIDLDRIDAEVDSLRLRDEAQARRFFFNEKRAAHVGAFDSERWAELADPERELEPEERVVSAAFGGERPIINSKTETRIVIGVDGARFRDALAVVAAEVSTGHIWPLGIWERPPTAEIDYEHPLDEVDGVVAEAFEAHRVERVYIDPQWIDLLLETWQGRWGDKRVIPWYTNRPGQVAHAVRRFAEAIGAGDLSHDGDETLAEHVANAVRRPVRARDDDGRQLWTIAKDRHNSPRKIDAAMAAVLAWEARFNVRREHVRAPATSARW